MSYDYLNDEYLMSLFVPSDTETFNDVIYRIGMMKKEGKLPLSWQEIAEVFNRTTDEDFQMTESGYRKRFNAMLNSARSEEQTEESKQDNHFVSDEEVELNEKIAELYRLKNKAHDERIAAARYYRNHARGDEIKEIFRTEIKAYEDNKPKNEIVIKEHINDKVMYVLLSDLHYGITFDNGIGKYDSEIAGKRLRYYASRIISIASDNDIDQCYVSIMGDMISGTNHTTIRIENKEDAIKQFIGATELIGRFIKSLTYCFDKVYVNNVAGNHSRITENIENALRNERLDGLIPYYLKEKFRDISNVIIKDNETDCTFGEFNILGKNYVCVHGDFEKDLKNSYQHISRMMKKNIDYLVAAHMHVPEIRFEGDMNIIRNGCVCGSGDEYTIKNRLFSKPIQMCMICSNIGVDSIYPIDLTNIE